jgi:preprotein translocase subunit SecY
MRTNVLAHRCLFTIFALFIVRFGSHIMLPGLDARWLQHMQASQSGLLNLLNLFSGGGLQRLSIFSLGIIPYVSASIFVQILTLLSDRLSDLQKNDPTRMRRLSAMMTRYTTVFISMVQSIGLCRYLSNLHITLLTNLSFYSMGILTLTTGTLFLMWLGEQITERGLGNGISFLILSGIIASFPTAIVKMFATLRMNDLSGTSILLSIFFIVALFFLVIFVEKGFRKVPMAYPRRGLQGESTNLNYMPIKINISGAIPPIFASSVVLAVSFLINYIPGEAHVLFSKQMLPGHMLHVVLYVMAIFFFVFFYVSVLFNVRDIAVNLKKSGACIPGWRPGQKTEAYLKRIVNDLSFIGACYLSFIILMPDWIMRWMSLPFFCSGTSILLVVVISMDLIGAFRYHLFPLKF